MDNFIMTEEVDIMFSSDKTVRLTTKRIIVDNGERQQEILLEDFIGYSIKRQNVGNFGILANIFGLLTFLLFLGVWNDNVPSLKQVDRLLTINIIWTSSYSIPFFICGPLFLISLFYYALGRRIFLELEGKYNSISIAIKNANNKSIKKFLKAITQEHDKIASTY